jgi:GH24 family phage-related lysozyme (muramidase)
MKRRNIAIMAMLALTAGQAFAQRCLPQMKGIEVKVGMADGVYNGKKSCKAGYYAGLGLSSYTKGGDKWTYGAEYLQVNQPYRNTSVPIAQMTGERFSPKMTERQADALLRSDLRKLCAMFRGFGHDSLLLAALAYNVGCGKVMKSRMYAKMRSGNRNIYRDYVDFKRWNGKIVPSIERRRKMEYLLLFTP